MRSVYHRHLKDSDLTPIMIQNKYTQSPSLKVKATAKPFLK
ncbi:hypothetical protein [Levilactobacillus fuyuanensis]